MFSELLWRPSLPDLGVPDVSRARIKEAEPGPNGFEEELLGSPDLRTFSHNSFSFF